MPTETCAKVPGSSSVIVCFPGQPRAATEAAERPLQFAEILLRVCVCVCLCEVPLPAAHVRSPNGSWASRTEGWLSRIFSPGIRVLED